MISIQRAMLLAPLTLLILFPVAVSAHETQVFEINHSLYKFVIGSFGEPVMVDDRTGVDLRISKVSGHIMPDGTVMAGMSHGGTYAVETPVEGLEETLQVELKAGSVSKVFDLSTVYGSVGAYKTTFYPTAPAELTYRVFGSIEDTLIDVSFSCNAAGHNMTATTTNTERVDLGGGVIRVSQKGGFSCPSAREEASFPEQVPSLSATAQNAGGAQTRSNIAIALSLAALLIGFIAYRKQ